MTDPIPAAHRDLYRGLLQFDYLPPELRAAEDATQVRDCHDIRHYPYDRPATPTEVALLRFLGYDVPADLCTRVHRITASIRRRWWPTLGIDEHPQETAP